MASVLKASAGYGLLIWLLLMFWSEADLISLLFVFAPLVVVPLAFGVVQSWNVQPLPRLLILLQPLFATTAAVSLLLPNRAATASAAAIWTSFTAAVACAGILRLTRSRTLPEISFAAGLIYIVAGGAGFLLAQLELTILGYSNPLFLLTGVHFHYAGFALQIIAGATGAALGRSRVYTAATWVIITAPAMVAAGFLLHNVTLRTAAALLLTCGVAILALLPVLHWQQLRPAAARVLLAIAAVSAGVAMALGAIYALGDFAGRVWITIPWMALTHGILNAFGFTTASLLAWSLEMPKLFPTALVIDGVAPKPS